MFWLLSCMFARVFNVESWLIHVNGPNSIYADEPCIGLPVLIRGR